MVPDTVRQSIASHVIPGTLSDWLTPVFYSTKTFDTIFVTDGPINVNELISPYYESNPIIKLYPERQYSNKNTIYATNQDSTRYKMRRLLTQKIQHSAQYGSMIN